VQWIAFEQVDDLALHPGFANSWPNLRGIIDNQAS
jgi:hypothetical protein